MPRTHAGHFTHVFVPDKGLPKLIPLDLKMSFGRLHA